MPTEFQNLMDLTLANINMYIEDILIVTKGTEQEHVNNVEKS